MPPTGWQDWGGWGWRRLTLAVQAVPPVSVSGPNLLPVAPTIAAHGLAGLGVLGVETVTLLTGRAGGLRPRRQRLECAYGRRSPSDGAPLATLSSGCDGLKCSASPPMDVGSEP